MRRILGLAFVTALAACQHSAALEPAVLVDGSDANIAALKSHLAEEMGTATITLGASDPTESSRFSVLPPPLGEHEARSPASPTQFQLLIQNGTCFVRRDGAETLIELTSVSCRLAN